MNPWNVDTLEKFLFFCCPECDLKDHSKVNFLQHALEKHPDAKECVLQFNEFIIKEEPSDTLDTNDKGDENINNENLYDIDENYGEMLECELKYEHNEDTIKNEPKSAGSKNPNQQILTSVESKQLYEAGKKDRYCAVCLKTFYSIQNLKQHIEAIHEGLRHKCPHCNEEFSFKKFELSLHQIFFWYFQFII